MDRVGETWVVILPGILKVFWKLASKEIVLPNSMEKFDRLVWHVRRWTNLGRGYSVDRAIERTGIQRVSIEVMIEAK